MPIVTGSVGNVTYTDGTILSGAQLNQHTHPISDYVPRFDKYNTATNVGSGTEFGVGFTNNFTTPLKVFFTTQTNALLELGQSGGTNMTSGLYIPTGSVIKSFSTVAGATCTTVMQMIVSGGTLNGL